LIQAYGTIEYVEEREGCFMPRTLEQIEEELRALPREQRAELIESLVSSLEEPESEVQREIEKAWVAVARNRMSDLKAGRTTGKPLADFMSEVRSRRV
jgi:putative addiction module component (TIGR02574 family)